MTRLSWSENPYSQGLDRGVLFVDSVVVWRGLVAVTENVSGGEVQSFYFDGSKSIDTVSSEDFALSVQALHYPLEFEPYDGLVDLAALQPRLTFGFSYREETSTGYRVHLVYNVVAAPTTKARETQSNQVTPADFTWEFSTSPELVPGAKPTAHLVVDTTFANPDALEAFEEFLYGTDDTDPALPTVDEVIEIFLDHAIFVVVDHGDGTWTATGPDEWITMLDADSFEITSPSAVYISGDSYTLSSM